MTEPEQTTPEAAPAATPATPTTIDDLASLLSEFEIATAKPPEVQQQTGKPGDVAPAEVAPDSIEAQLAKLNGDLNSDAMRTQLGTVTNAVQALFEHQRVMQDRADYENVISKADELLKNAGVAVSSEFARRFLTAEAAIDPVLRSAFDNRNQSPQHQKYYERQERKALQRLLDAARMEPDQEATATRMAVAAAVKGTVTRMPEKPAPRYGDMTDAEFNAEKKKHGV